MGLVTKIFGRGHDKPADSAKRSESDRVAADRMRQLSVPTAQSITDQASVRAHMEEELVQQRERRQSAEATAAE